MIIRVTGRAYAVGQEVPLPNDRVGVAIASGADGTGLWTEVLTLGEHETVDPNRLSDTVRALVLHTSALPVLTIYRQPGGCLEVNQWDESGQDIVHVCDVHAWYQLARGMIAVADNVPVR
jgi:hypothetical protein